MSQAAQPRIAKQAFTFGEFVLDPRTRELLKRGSLVRLQEQPFQVLTVLVEHAGEIVTREELRRHLWPADTFVDFDNGLNAAVAKIREALADSPDDPKFIETLPRRGYRFIAPVEIPVNGNHATKPHATSEIRAEHRVWRAILAALLVGMAVGGIGYWARQRFAQRITDKDTVVLADFDNRTGDPIFDDTLGQALAVQLQQSPFLNIVPDKQVRETMRLMERSPNDRATGAVAQEICERQGGKVVLQGAIKTLGGHYVLTVNAINCRTGTSLSEDQAEVAGKERILATLGTMASRLRSNLGESLALVEKYDTPVAEATTSSLEALRAFTLGVKEQEEGNNAGAVPFFKRAIELDPNFALAYIRLYIADWDIGEYELGREAAAKAFNLRQRASERERLSIVALYHDIVTGDLKKVIDADELLAKTYPREWIPHASLATNYTLIGSFDAAVEESKAVIRIAPQLAFGYGNLAIAEGGLNHWQESRSALEHLISIGDESQAYSCLFQIVFAEGDEPAAQKYLEMGNAKVQDNDRPAFQLNQAEMALFQGKLESARELVDAAVRSADQIDLKQNQPAMLAQEARWEAQVGNLQRARSRATSIAKTAHGIDVELNAALALALAGELRSAEKMADDLERTHPDDTILKTVSLPLIRSTVALERGHPAQTLQLLKSSEGYEMGIGLYYYPALMPTYTRGQAYLKMHNGPKAAAEFRKILDHRGSGPASLNYVLAQLGLGRANVLAGNTVEGRRAYRNFLSLWKDADAEIPILKQAKAEYAKLQ